MIRSYSVGAVECPHKSAEAEAEARTHLLRQAHSDGEDQATSEASRLNRFSTFVIPRPELSSSLSSLLTSLERKDSFTTQLGWDPDESDQFYDIIKFHGKKFMELQCDEPTATETTIWSESCHSHSSHTVLARQNSPTIVIGRVSSSPGPSLSSNSSGSSPASKSSRQFGSISRTKRGKLSNTKGAKLAAHLRREEQVRGVCVSDSTTPSGFSSTDRSRVDKGSTISITAEIRRHRALAARRVVGTDERVHCHDVTSSARVHPTRSVGSDGWVPPSPTTIHYNKSTDPRIGTFLDASIEFGSMEYLGMTNNATHAHALAQTVAPSGCYQPQWADARYRGRTVHPVYTLQSSPTTTRQLCMDQRQDPTFLVEGCPITRLYQDLEETPFYMRPGFTSNLRSMKTGSLTHDHCRYPVVLTSQMDGGWSRAPLGKDASQESSSYTTERGHIPLNDTVANGSDLSHGTGQLPNLVGHSYLPVLASSPFHPNIHDPYSHVYFSPYPPPLHHFHSNATEPATSALNHHHEDGWEPHIPRPRRRHSMTLSVFRPFSTTATNVRHTRMDESTGQYRPMSTMPSTEGSMASDPVKPRRQWKLFGLWNAMVKARSKDTDSCAACTWSRTNGASQNVKKERQWQRHGGFQKLQTPSSK
jgi:hypothetical protein